LTSTKLYRFAGVEPPGIKNIFGDLHA